MTHQRTSGTETQKKECEQKVSDTDAGRWEAAAQDKWSLIRWKWHGIRHVTNYSVILLLANWLIICTEWQYNKYMLTEFLLQGDSEILQHFQSLYVGLHLCTGPTCYFITLLCSSWNVPILCLQGQLYQCGHVHKISTTLLQSLNNTNHFLELNCSWIFTPVFYQHFISLPIFPRFLGFHVSNHHHYNNLKIAANLLKIHSHLTKSLTKK